MPHLSAPTLSEIEAAHRLIAPSIVRTPCLESVTLGRMIGARLWLKFENHQFTASFKERGALNLLSKLPEADRKAGVVAMSAGNHAQGVAYHAARLGIPAVIVMPEAAPAIKVRNTAAHGARVVLKGRDLDEARSEAFAIAQREGRHFVHPYDDAAIIAGQGTCALEMLADVPELDTLVVPVGGGGLIAGMAIAAKAIKPSIRIIGVQSERNPAMALAMDGQVQAKASDSLAEGIAVSRPGTITAAVVRDLVDEIVLIPEDLIERAIGLLVEIEKTVTEGAGAAGLAALLHRPDLVAGRRVGVVLCGGNIDTRLLAAILPRYLMHEGRLSRTRIALADRPGQLQAIVAVCAAERANILSIQHERMHVGVSPKDVIIEVVVETEDRTHRDRLMAAWIAAGLAPVDDA